MNGMSWQIIPKMRIVYFNPSFADMLDWRKECPGEPLRVNKGTYGANAFHDHSSNCYDLYSCKIVILFFSIGHRLLLSCDAPRVIRYKLYIFYDTDSYSICIH